VDLIVVAMASRLSGYLRRSPRPAKMMSYGSGVLMLGLGAYIAGSDTGR
jgi:threonine/homoserine/homoserine lactone efflux protein